MLWWILVLIATFIWAWVNIIDKHIVSDELKDPILCTTVYGFVSLTIFGIFTLFYRNLALSANTIFFSMAAGAVMSIAIWFYYKALSHEEVSRVMPMFAMGPLFVLLLATIFFNEIFTPLRYLGIFLLVGGSILVSSRGIYKRKKHVFKIKLSKVLGIVLTGAFLFAIRSSLIKYVTLGAEFLQVLFWFALGSFIVSLIFLAFHHPHLRSKIKIKGIEHLIMISVLSIAGIFPFIAAISLAPVSLVAAFGGIQNFFVLIFAALLTKFKPDIIRERVSKKIIITKIIAIVLLIAGAILII